MVEITVEVNEVTNVIEVTGEERIINVEVVNFAALAEAVAEAQAAAAAAELAEAGAEADAALTAADAIATAADRVQTGLDAAATAADAVQTDLDRTAAAASAAAAAASAASIDPADFATAAQGDLADTATQPGDNVSTLTNDAGYLTSPPPSQLQAVWNAGADDTESIISAEKLAGAIAAQAASSPLVLLSRTVISGSPSTVDFTFDPTLYDEIRFVLSNVKPSTTAVIQLQTSSNGGASYDAGASDYAFLQEAKSINGTTVSDLSAGNSSTTNISLASSVASGGANEGFSATVSVLGPGIAQRTQVSCAGAVRRSSGFHTSIYTTGVRVSSADVDAVRFALDLGTFTSGTITMYGVRNA